MDRRAIEKALGKLERARVAHDIICRAAEIHQINLAWFDFISACGVIYSTLEKGAKHHKESTFWYGGKKHMRKTDPLLKYLRDARNAEEHGVEQITQISAKAVLLKERGTMVKFVSDGKNWNVEQVSGPPIQFQEPKLVLKRVYNDRSGGWTEPPDSHLGCILQDQSPKTVTSLALIYFHEMLIEAATLVTQKP